MRRVNSTDFKPHFNEFADLVRDGPIEVLRGGKPVGVFLSPDAFAHLQRLDDAQLQLLCHRYIATICGTWLSEIPSIVDGVW
jgi:PHD/YefM family antitoxin component YafN of YafNO toxin-antitoxin module